MQQLGQVRCDAQASAQQAEVAERERDEAMKQVGAGEQQGAAACWLLAAHASRCCCLLTVHYAHYWPLPN